ncbi:MAG: MoaD/ThiS family protein [Bdellovibrionales bacterium]|nr:MoaD/ThiS family protein [Ramlibacter sp.]
MKVRIKYFASIREAIGQPGETVQTDSPDLATLRRELIARGGAYAEALAPGKAVRVALQQVMSDESSLLSDDAEVAFFPPVTGG